MVAHRLELCAIPEEIEELTPQGLRERHAAKYCGIGVACFRTHVTKGHITARMGVGKGCT